MFRNLPDLINPLDGILGRAVHGPMHEFTFLIVPPTTPYDVELVLRQYGIRVWGRDTSDGDEGGFFVKRSQAVWAEYLLCRAGVPLTCKLLDPRNEAYVQRHAPGAMPRPWQEEGIGPVGIVDHVIDWLARFLP